MQFVHEDVDLILSEMKADMEDRLKRQIAPADVEQLLINGFAYRELLLRGSINDAARQNLVSFSRGAALEYLGQLVGVNRLMASPALCTIEFKLIEGHTGVIIPEGKRIQSLDGKVSFRTIDSVVVAPGILTVTVGASCLKPGKVGNDYPINTIQVMLDPEAYIVSQRNIDIPTGGADDETDDELRERIKIAPATFSVAGPRDAYKYFAKSASPSIVDVAVTSPEPGLVKISPLLNGGLLPSAELLNAVLAICNGEKIRPLTDTVIVEAPTVEEFEINVVLTLLDTAVNTNADVTVAEKLNDWIAQRKNRLGLDVIVSKIKSLSMIDGVVYDVTVVSPADNIVVPKEVYTKCTGVTVTIGGTHDE